MKRIAVALLTALLAVTATSSALAEESDLMRAMRRVADSTRKLSDSERELVAARARYEAKMKALAEQARKIAAVLKTSDAAAPRPAWPGTVKPIPGSFRAQPVIAKPVLRRPAAMGPLGANPDPRRLAKRAPAKPKAPSRLAALRAPSRLAALRAPAQPEPGSIYKSLTFQR
ncbi:MAG: hypothetical protein CVU56_14735 [Deltaproteobacteria bacterium HGW-Deltaproteobacteria-14]|jgi:hypothetical protein|nr:MAG: hypothetical protein CVU56_14735 [Deltaproteobacteria bacterium HGW-Deltaproteobacteria-14]